MANDVAVRNDTALAPMPEVVNPQTGELVTQDFYAGISMLQLSSQESSRLAEPIPDEDLDILPTGEVYCSQVRYRRILNEVFGPGAWGMRPMSEPKVHGQTIMRLYALYARGTFIAEAPGECDYQPNNSRMSYATALEAAKSNALMRCCKDLGIASACWDRRFCEEFKREHCVQVGGKWYRKDRAPGGQRQQAAARTAGPVERQDGAKQVAAPPPVNDDLRARRLAVFKRVGVAAPTDPGAALKALTALHGHACAKLSDMTEDDCRLIEDMDDVLLAARILDAQNDPQE